MSAAAPVSRSTLVSLAVVVGVVAVVVWLATRNTATSGGSLSTPLPTGGGDAEGAQYIAAVGGAVRDILGGVGSLYGQAGGSSTGARGK